jgi:hypothetical protein
VPPHGCSPPLNNPCRSTTVDKGASWLVKPSLPAFPVRSHAYRRSEPPLAAVRRLGPRGPFLTPQLGSPSHALPPGPGPSQNRGWNRDIAHLQQSSAARRHLSRYRRFPRRCSAPSPASPPLDPEPTVRTRFNPSQTDLIPVNPWSFCSLALKFSRNQPAVHVSSKVFTSKSFFFWLGP